MRTRYYSILRPIVPGSFPEPQDNHIMRIENFDKRVYIPEIEREAWGYIDYEDELAGPVADEYELIRKDELESRVKAIIGNRFAGWESTEGDAETICEVIRVLTNRRLTVDHAAAILKDTLRVIPKVKTL